MFRWLLLATFLAVTLAEEPAAVADSVAEESVAAKTAAEPEAEESRRIHHGGDDNERYYNDYGEGLPGTGVVREVVPSGHPLPEHRIKEQNRIVYDRYSPTYYQPQWILDYRYLKTGGRDYVRGDGGQILILPKGIKAPPDEKKQFGNFDELLEHLRLQELAEREDLHRRRTQSHPHLNRHDEDEEPQERWSHRDHQQEPVGWKRENERESRQQLDEDDDDERDGRRGNERDGRRGNERDGRRGNERDGRRGGERDGRRGNERDSRRENERDGRRGRKWEREQLGRNRQNERGLDGWEKDAVASWKLH